MHPQITSMPAEARDAFYQSLASAGALAFVNASAACAASPALYKACAARKQAWPFVPLSHTLGGATCSLCRQKHVPRAWVSTGRMPNTLSASKPPALRDERVGSSSTALQQSMGGATPGVRGATEHPWPWAWSARKGPACPRGAPRMASGSFPSIRSPWPRTAPCCPRAGPKMPPPMPHSSAHGSSHTVPSAAPKAPPCAPWRHASQTAGA